MVSLVIVMLTMMAIAGSVLTLRHVRRNREVDALFLQLRIRDGLLTDESLAAADCADGASAACTLVASRR